MTYSANSSTLYFSWLTAVDYGYLGFDGRLYGDSFSVSLELRGPVESNEQVVIDFGTAKKLLKQWIDDKESGLDHKVWLPSRAAMLRSLPHGTGQMSQQGISVWQDENGTVCVRTPHIEFSVPRNAVVHVDWPMYPVPESPSLMDRWLEDESELQNRRELLTEYLNKRLDAYAEQMAAPGSTTKPAYTVSNVDIRRSFLAPPLKTQEQQRTAGSTNRGWQQSYKFALPGEVIVPFHYTHGLKNSSSWGCQNISHGHRSFLMASVDQAGIYDYLYQEYGIRTSGDLVQLVNDWMSHLEFCLARVAPRFHNKTFMWKQNCATSPSYEDRMDICYTTDRGRFAMAMDAQDGKWYDSETTVENLADTIGRALTLSLKNSQFVHKYYHLSDGEQDRNVEVVEAGLKNTKLFVSEGIQKGAVVFLGGA